MTDHKELRRLAAKTLEGEPMTPAQLVEAYDLSDIAEMLFEANTLRIKDAQAVTALLDELDTTKRHMANRISESGAHLNCALIAATALEKAVAERDQLIARLPQVLRTHWITGVECDHGAKTDVATCYCSVWRSAPQPNVGAAVDQWISHVLEALATPHTAATPEPDTQGICNVCGQPMPPGEEMFKFHGYSGPCPTPLRERVAAWASSPHGKEALKATADNVRKAIDQIDQDSKVDWKTMSEPLTAAADSVQVRTPPDTGGERPGWRLVCEECGASDNQGCTDSRCPIRPKQGV